MNLKIEQEIETFKAMSRAELAKYFHCKEEEICMGDYIARDTLDTVCPYVVIMGFANFEDSYVESTGKLKVVFGSKILGRTQKDSASYIGINFKGSKIKSTGKIVKVYGSVSLNKLITSLNKIRILGSNLYLNNTNIINLGDLNEINGILSLDDSILKSLCKLEKVTKIYAYHCILNDFGDLNMVKSIEFRDTEINQLVAKIRKLEQQKIEFTKHINKNKQLLKHKNISPTNVNKINQDLDFWLEKLGRVEKDLENAYNLYYPMEKYEEMKKLFYKQFKLVNKVYVRNPEYLY